MGNKLTYPEADLSGKVALVTGGNTGVGYETAKGLARLGAHTFIACRSKERAESALERMRNELARTQQGTVKADSQQKEPGEDEEVRNKDDGSQPIKEVKVEYIPLDLASFQSTKECVRIFKERDLPLHILVNNAAVLGPVYRTTEDNLESQLQVNHLSPVLLTLELLPILLNTATISGDVRILFLSSMGHDMAEPFNIEYFQKTEDQFKRIKDYCNTKLYNVMSGFCLQRRLQNKGITVSSVHPGYVRSELDRESRDRKLMYAVNKLAVNIVGRTPTEGAATSLNCAVNPKLNSQQHFYYDSCKTKVSSVDSRNEEFQEQMWKKTFEFLKDQLSPEIYEKYGPQTEEEPTQQPVKEGEEEEAETPAGKEEILPVENEETPPTVKEGASTGEEEAPGECKEPLQPVTVEPVPEEIFAVLETEVCDKEEESTQPATDEEKTISDS